MSVEQEVSEAEEKARQAEEAQDARFMAKIERIKKATERGLAHELKGEEAIEFLMNHPSNCTREEAEEIVATMAKNGSKFMVTSPFDGLMARPKHEPSPFLPASQVDREEVFDTDEELFLHIEEALSDPETNVVMVQAKKKSKDGLAGFALGGRNAKSKVLIWLFCDNYERAERARQKYGYDFGLSHDEVDARLGFRQTAA